MTSLFRWFWTVHGRTSFVPNKHHLKHLVYCVFKEIIFCTAVQDSKFLRKLFPRLFLLSPGLKFIDWFFDEMFEHVLELNESGLHFKLDVNFA